MRSSQWPDVTQRKNVLRRPTEICTWTLTLPTVHCRHQWHRWQPQPQIALLRWRHSAADAIHAHFVTAAAGERQDGSLYRRHRLRLNPPKTEFLWCATSRRLHHIDNTLINISGKHNTIHHCPQSWRDNEQWHFYEKPYVKLSRSCFCFMRRIRGIRRSLTMKAAKTFISSFVCSRIDYCNTVFANSFYHRQLLTALMMFFMLLHDWYQDVANTTIVLRWWEMNYIGFRYVSA